MRSLSCGEWVFPKWAWSGSMNNFYIVDLENVATASRRYTGDIHNSPVVGLFMTPIGQWKRLDRITCLLHIGPLYPSNFITLISSGLVVKVLSALLRGNWQDFNWHDTSRGSSAIAELLVSSTVPKIWCVEKCTTFWGHPVYVNIHC